MSEENIIQTPDALEELTAPTSISDLPNDRYVNAAPMIKAKFDENAADIVSQINEKIVDKVYSKEEVDAELTAEYDELQGAITSLSDSVFAELALKINASDLAGFSKLPQDADLDEYTSAGLWFFGKGTLSDETFENAVGFLFVSSDSSEIDQSVIFQCGGENTLMLLHRSMETDEETPAWGDWGVEYLENFQANWTEPNPNDPSYIKNKPSVYSQSEIDAKVDPIQNVVDELYKKNSYSFISEETFINYAFVEGHKYTISATKQINGVKIRDNQGTELSSLGNIAANEIKTYTAQAGAAKLRCWPQGSGSVVIIDTNTIIPTALSELAEKANAADVYDKSQVDSAVAGLTSAVSSKANAADVYSKSDTNTLLTGKLDKSVFDKVYMVTEFEKSTSGAGDVTQAYNFIAGNNYEFSTNKRLTAVVLRDSANNSITGYVWTNIAANTSFTFVAPEGAVKIYMYFAGPGKAVLKNLNTVIPYLEHTFNGAKVANPYKGKTMTVLGDSICKGSYAGTGHRWFDIIKNRYGMDSVAVLAEDGKCYSKDGSGTNYRITKIVEDIDTVNKPDIIAVFAGTNDYSFDVPLGNISDAADGGNNAGFCPAVKYTMEYLLTNFPDSKIIFITPLQRKYLTESYNAVNSAGHYLFEYVNAIRELAGIYGVILCDLFRDSEFHVFNSTFKSAYTGNNGDGLHPNQAGTELYVKNGIIPTFDRALLDFNTAIKNVLKDPEA